MAYAQEMLEGALIRKSNALDTAEVLTASAAVYGGYLVGKRFEITRILFYVTTDTAGTVPAQVEFNKRPTYNSAAGEILIGTLTIPSGAVAGSVIYKDVPPVALEVGDELSFEHTVAASGGVPAGAGFYGFVADLLPQTPANEANMIKSV